MQVCGREGYLSTLPLWCTYMVSWRCRPTHFETIKELLAHLMRLGGGEGGSTLISIHVGMVRVPFQFPA